MAEVGCGRPTGATVGDTAPDQQPEQAVETKKEKLTMQVQVGKKAPDFEAPAYLKGEFTSVKLSEHLGKWVVLCFYPGDFTFV